MRTSDFTQTPGQTGRCVLNPSQSRVALNRRSSLEFIIVTLVFTKLCDSTFPMKIKNMNGNYFSFLYLNFYYWNKILKYSRRISYKYYLLKFFLNIWIDCYSNINYITFKIWLAKTKTHTHTHIHHKNILSFITINIKFIEYEIFAKIIYFCLNLYLKCGLYRKN